MIVGSSEVVSKQIPIITIMLIFANICMFTKSYMLECQAAHEHRQNFMIQFDGASYESGSTEKGDAANEFFDKYGFQMNDFKEQTYYSVISHMFVHGGIMHILGNMLALWAFAVTLEEIYGMGIFTGVYFICGLAACMTQGLCDMDSTVPMVGASGAVAGILGAYCITFGAAAKVKFLILFFGAHIVEIPASVFAILWISMQALAFANGGASGGGVAIAAHLGGCGAGLAIGYFLKSEVESRFETDNKGVIIIASAKDTGPTEAQILDDILACQPFNEVIETLSDSEIACPRCGANLDMSSPVGDRLVRCHSDQCSHMTYVDGNLLVANM